jgi:DNA-binding transcriptional regulator YiaG
MNLAVLRALTPYLIAFLVGAVPAWMYQSARWEADVSNIKREAAEAQAAAVSAARKEERRMQKGVDEAAAIGEQDAIQNDAAAIAAGDDAQRLRDEIAQLRRRFAVDNSRLATQWATTAETVRVLAGLLEDADGEAEILTGAYETARNRGLVCEWSYDALTPE